MKTSSNHQNIELKLCSKCGEVKPHEHFHKDPQNKSGRSSYCGICKATHRRTWRRANPGRERENRQHWRKNNPERVREINAMDQATHRKRYPERIRARNAVVAAIVNGKPICQPCVICGELKVDGHHPDYSKPLDVMWLCRKHHTALHTGHLTLGAVA